MKTCLNIQESLDPIKLFFFSEFQTKEFKEFTRLKIRKLSPYQFYHVLAWLLENIKDDALLSNLDVLFDFSDLDAQKYNPSKVHSFPLYEEPNEGPNLPSIFGEDCMRFYHMDYSTIKLVSEESKTLDRVNRFQLYFKSRKAIKSPKLDYERLLNLMSLDERLCFPVYSFPDEDSAPFYGHALNFLKSRVSSEASSLEYTLTDELRKEGEKIKKLFVGARRDELPYVLMDGSALLLPLLVGFENWKRLVIDALKQKQLFNLLKTKLLFSLQELQEVIGEEYFQDLTTNVHGRSLIVKNRETGINTLKSISSPLVHSSKFVNWLKKLKASDLKVAIKKEIELVPQNQVIISKKGSQVKLKKAILEFFGYLKIGIDDEKERTLESFLYRNFSFEAEDTIDFSKRTVSNYGYRPLSFIPSKHAKDFTKLLLYLSDKNYLLSSKTHIVRMLDEDIHEKNGKDGFSYSSLIRIPSDEHHLFPNTEVRRRIRSILKIDD
ncbi:hypothetical protein [Maribacter sp. 4G9]|uniref:hypothetical protein n=1 Tax=Maribacter sp. 4G9 TaxID=1889777 RepID=UPI000F4DCCF0|nr:hypothetical protein [Maribacter sp. 4G9]